MKQNITVEQLNELSDEQKDRLARWIAKNINGQVGEYALKTLSIGQMIEFLDEQDDYFKSWYKKGGEGEETPSHTNRVIEWEYGDELCDDLWEAVKEVLNE